MKLERYLKKVDPDRYVAVAFTNSIWEDCFEKMYYSTYTGIAAEVPDYLKNYNVKKTFISFMWNTLTIIVEKEKIKNG